MSESALSERRNSLSPPTPTKRDTEDPGAHDLASDSEEHFSDAQSSQSGSPTSPIPRTRVEKVDDKPAYGEVPGTSAYRLREGDAAPDEIAIIPDPDSSDTKVEESENQEARPLTPGGHPIPKTVVEETPDDTHAVTHPEVEEKHKADPPPDLVLKADGERVGDDGVVPVRRRKSSLALQKPPLSQTSLAPHNAASGFGGGSENVDYSGNNNDDEEDGFGDDFDDFEEGDEEGDFGDFDNDFQHADTEKSSAPVAAPDQIPSTSPPPPRAPSSFMSLPIPDFEDLDAGEIFAATEPYLDALFPSGDGAPKLLPSLSSKENPIFLTPRSASLWSQLVAPPPLQPPDWIRSRIRRLFLVSLGVPVDLDEILPASKQKKLVLPSLHRASSSGSLRRASTDSRSLSRVRNTNVSTTSVDSQGNLKPSGAGGAGGVRSATGSPAGPSSSLGKRRGPPSPDPTFDLMTARQLCTTTDAALHGMTEKELHEHLARLQALEVTAKEVLEYWQKRTDEKIGDKEAFEGVIENLVKHARKVRK
ncbi:hypothetical protein B0T24DRAFT_673141 [Lasiosphaeria ovina]|uniref:Uncharacterized protein n=1 Tax=Lasiosphaeria ovina TaxID=92902 RepID=A0AAE0TXL3_9PEZI|nr:hypothetical protein B0T24DRAFT_673141 [Lasiosphaeria ovina]